MGIYSLDLIDLAKAELVSIPKGPDFRPRCHLAVLRTHIDFTSYSLFKDRESGEAVALIRSWERILDEDELDDQDFFASYPDDKQPTMTSWQVPIEADEVDKIIRHAEGVSVPIRLPGELGGSDGTVYVLTLFNSNSAIATFEWWQSSWMQDDGITVDGPAPPGWEELFGLAQRILRLAGGPVWPGPFTKWDGPPSE